MTKILLYWALFDVLVYALMWYDRKVHKHNFKKTFHDIKESFTQDE